jgi:hypothetical protein
MGWGCNATFVKRPCRFCGIDDIDDQDMGGSTHERKCPERFIWCRAAKKLRRFFGGQ